MSDYVPGGVSLAQARAEMTAASALLFGSSGTVQPHDYIETKMKK